MTSIARTPSLDVLLALCCECGCVRTVSRQASVRPLRCAACGRPTRHATIGDGPDTWERENRETTLNLSMDDQLDLLRSLGVEIRSLPDGYASVCRWLDDPEWVTDDPEWVVSVNLTAEDQRGLASVMTEVVARVIRPDDHQWYVGTDDGQTYISVEWCCRAREG